MYTVPDTYHNMIGTGKEPSDGKEGHKCCGGCCDTRRAVIIVNIINALMISFSLLSVYLLKEIYNEPYHGFANAGFYRTISVMRIIISCIGILGAIKFKIYMVGFTLMMYLLDAGMALLGFNPLHSIVMLLFAYPHFFFMQEVKNGIMSEENYPNEEHSCCCV